MAASQRDFDNLIIHTDNALAFAKIIIVLMLFLGVWVQFQPECSTECGTSIAWCAVPNASNSKNTVGKSLFINNCAQCHAKDMKTKLTGPSLEGTNERWSAYPRADLYEWIRNSQNMIKKGHPRAKKLWLENKPTIMPSYPQLSDEDVENLLDYIGS